MASLVALKNRAKELGIPGSLIRASMDNPDTLAELIEGFEKGKAHVEQVKSRTRKTRTVKSSKGGRMAPRARAKAKADKQETPKRRRGRPVGSKNKQTTTRTASKPVRRGRPPKSTPTPTRKPQARKNADEAGRNTIGKVNFSKTEGWNPREGSAVDEIWQELKKAKGDREKAFKALIPDVWFFVGKTMANGSKRALGSKDGSTPGSAYAMLKYRVHRTLYDFVIQTGQHEASENRIKYGSGTNGNKSQPARKRAVSRAIKAEPKAAPRKRGRPKGSTTKAKATPTRTRTTTRRRTRARR